MAGIPYVRDLEFKYGEAAQVSPLIRRVIANNPGPFTYLGTGVYIIGKGDVAVIDPGPLLDEHLEALKRALAGRAHHAHLHHPHPHGPFRRWPIRWLQWAECKDLRPPRSQWRPRGNHPGGGRRVRLHARRLRQRRRCLQRPRTGRSRPIATPGHMSNHVCYALKERNALFSGDHIMGWSTTVITPPDGSMRDYFASLDKVKAEGFADDLAEPRPARDRRSARSSTPTSRTARPAEQSIVDRLKAGGRAGSRRWSR